MRVTATRSSEMIHPQHTDVEARLHEEIDRELGDRPAEITDLPRLSYCEMVFSEAMRYKILRKRSHLDHY